MLQLHSRLHGSCCVIDMIDKLVIWNDQNILRAVRVYVAKLRSTHWREASRCTRPIPLRMHAPKRAESKGNISKPKASIQKSGTAKENIEYAEYCGLYLHGRRLLTSLQHDLTKYSIN